MRVVNDKEEKPEHPELGFLAVSLHSILVCLGIVTILFGPLTMIYAHLRLPEPWSKVTAIAGALLALLVLEAPYQIVAVVFAVSLLIADGVKNETGFWTLFRNVTLVFAAVGVAFVIGAASAAHVSVGQYWIQQVDQVVTVFQTTFTLAGPDLENMRVFLRTQGPFLLLVTVIFSFWLSIGLAAHLEWITGEHPYSGAGLRKLRVPLWVNYAIAALVLAACSRSPWQPYLAGLANLGGCVLFIQGFVLLSEVFAHKQWQPWARTLAYAIAVVFGYAVMAVGFASPWIHKRKEYWRK